MDFKYYRWSFRHIIGLALLLGGLATALWLDNRTLAFVLCGLLALAFAALIQLYRHVFESIDLMFKALINEDYTFRLPIRNRLNGYRCHLNEQFNAYSRHVRRLRQAQHEHDVFHQLVMEHIRTGVVVADETGRVLQANPTALQLLEVHTLRDIAALKIYGNEVMEAFRESPPGIPRPITLRTPSEQKTLWMHVARLTTQNGIWRLITLDDTRPMLDGHEVDTWHKLLHVLSHEIMNSITPIISLSAALTEKESTSREDCLKGLQVIHDTSNGLLCFVENCRKFMSLPQPLPCLFYVKELFAELQTLPLVPVHIAWNCHTNPTDLMLYADKALIRQMLLNLIRNAVQAIGDQPGHIACKAYDTADDHVVIQVSNDGPAIPEAERAHVFTPFFTTKRQGSGLGLSVCRQIMTASHGTISLWPAGTQGWNTTFVLDFA